MAGKVFAAVYDAVMQIPRGRVATYGTVAMMAGSPRGARVVGYALHANPRPGVIPCHRVVDRFGQVSPAFAFGGGNAQIDLLRGEGVAVTDDGVVDLKKYGWMPGME